MKNTPNPFQKDLTLNKYHLFDLIKAKENGYYPKELLGIIEQIGSFKQKFPIKIGDVYGVRAFFAFSEPINGEVQFQSGYLDLKLLLEEKDTYIGEIQTILPPIFVLKKGSKIKFRKENIIAKIASEG
ncbi:MAG: hypothetical protein KBA66_16105 [Leptospiraceae bacterium]|nr:hypothetical protein [Leptospiraceae bacterium]